MKAYFQMLTGYNTWANARVYAACATLSDAERKKNRQAFFASIHNTLNHLLLADRIWLHRFTGEGETYTRLDTVLYEDWKRLAAMRRAEDKRISGVIDALSEERIAAPLSYRTISSPQAITQPLVSALMHLFNHQTHHRGQVHTLLSQAGQNPPALDLILYQRESGAGMAASPLS